MKDRGISGGIAPDENDNPRRLCALCQKRPALYEIEIDNTASGGTLTVFACVRCAKGMGQ